MKVTRISRMSGKLRTRELPVTEEQLRAWRHGALIQEVMPDLDEDDREFLQTGITPEEWRELDGNPNKE